MHQEQRPKLRADRAIRATRWLRTIGIAAALLLSRTAFAVEPARSTLQADLAALHAATSDSDRLAVLARLAQAEAASASASARAIEQLLREGQTDAVTDRALEALGTLAQSESRELLVLFAGHRRVGARTRAYAALAKLRSDTVDPLIARGLHDASPEVRSLSARTLGDRGARGMLDQLWSALSHGVPEAATAIGKLGDAAEVKRLQSYVGKLPLPQLLDGYQAFMCRKELSDSSKLEIVATLEEISGEPVHLRLQQLLGRTDCKQSTRVQRALLASVARTKPSKNPPATTRPQP